jgi:hypothetical protein
MRMSVRAARRTPCRLFTFAVDESDRADPRDRRVDRFDRASDTAARIAAIRAAVIGRAFRNGTPVAVTSVVSTNHIPHVTITVRALFVAACLAACGGSGESEFHDGSPSNGQAGGDSNAFGAGSEPSSANPTNLEACVTSVAEGVAVPVHLVVMYDKSGSMRDDGKWAASNDAMTSFLAAPATAGMEAALEFFSYNDSCDVELYATPAVAMRKLPDATAFKTAIAAEAPGGKTPTLPAMKGAIKYAKSVEQSLTDGSKVAIVLVTDGLPNGCGSTPENVGAEAATVAATIKTHVIGIGPALQNLDTIAQGGGTSKAVMVSTGNPAQTTSELVAALGQVKSAIGCEYTIPPAPPGETLDYKAVNVAFTNGGASSTLSYSADCATDGWHYDDETNPTRIIVCKQSCDALLAGAAGGKVQIQFGCATKGSTTR